MTIGFGVIGAAAFLSAGFPAPILSGSMIGVLLAMMLRLKPAMPDTMRDFAMFLSGCGYGSAITRDMLSSIGHYPISLCLLALTVALIVAASKLWLTRVAGWDAKTATYASIPGALSAVLAVAAEAKADMARVVIVQTIRSLILVVLLPGVVVATGTITGHLERVAAGLIDCLVILAGSLLGALVFRRLRIVAPFMFGSMLVSAALHVSGLVQGFLPQQLTDAGFVLLGGYFGTRFTGLSLSTLRESAVHAGASFLITMGLASLAELIVIETNEVGFGEALVAFAPGGLEAMMAVAGSLGLNPLYVGAHHFGRLIGINVLLPILGPWLTRGEGKA